MAADDGHEYVVKFQGNPQTTRVLANEYLAGRLARMIGLSVPDPVIIHDLTTVGVSGPLVKGKHASKLSRVLDIPEE